MNKCTLGVALDPLFYEVEMEFDGPRDMVFAIVGGLGIFLLGMKNMSEGIQAIAGDRIRSLINRVTNNRLVACGVGTVVTCLVQSSSITTVMVVGMVNAGIMNLVQAVGVILGANVGTTITGWILVLKVGDFGLPIIGFSAFLYLFARNERWKFIASFLVGLGMIFYGLKLMKVGFEPMSALPGFEAWFQRFSPTHAAAGFEAGTLAHYFATYFGVLKCVLVGAILTAIVQSSSATLAITIGLATSGVIDYPTAAALVLGENIGTTLTAFLASIAADIVEARRAAYAHMTINFIGVFWITLVFPWYIQGIENFVVHHDPDTAVAVFNEAGEPELNDDGIQKKDYPYITGAIAATHTGFNVANALLFMPFVGVLCRFLVRMAPDRQYKEKSHLTLLDMRMVESPAISIQQSQRELIRMGEATDEMLDKLEGVVESEETDKGVVDRIFSLENKCDLYQKEIVEFLSQIVTGNISLDVMQHVRMQIRTADELESVSDYIVTILKLNLKSRNTGERVSSTCATDLKHLHGTIVAYNKMIVQAIAEGNGEVLNKATIQGNAITHEIKESRSRHLERLSSRSAASSPLASLIFTDTLNAYRRIKDHGLNIAESLAGEK